MKDHLEQFVNEHRSEFDVFEPSDELWKDIDKKINASKKRTISFYIYRAAAVAALFIFTLGLQKYISGNKGKVEIPELREAEVYYSGLMNTKMQIVEPMLSDNPMLEQELNHDLTELDSIYKSLKEDLKDNISNQEVIEAMISNYRLRIDILEEMVEYLNEDESDINNNNNSGYEL